MEIIKYSPIWLVPPTFWRHQQKPGYSDRHSFPSQTFGPWDYYYTQCSSSLELPGYLLTSCLQVVLYWIGFLYCHFLCTDTYASHRGSLDYNHFSISFCTEKGNGEYQLSTSTGDEKWEVPAWLSLHTQVSAAGEGQADHPCQQCPTT